MRFSENDLNSPLEKVYSLVTKSSLVIIMIQDRMALLFAARQMSRDERVAGKPPLNRYSTAFFNKVPLRIEA